MKINELEDGQLVHGQNGYSRVKTCVHGNQYYAYIDDINNNDDDENCIEVTDDDDDHIPCCS